MNLSVNHFSRECSKNNDSNFFPWRMEPYTPIPGDDKPFDDNVNISLSSAPVDLSISEFSEATTSNKFVSPFATVMNMLNSLVGAEILSISHSMRYCGLYVSVALMTVTALLSYCATILTVKMQYTTKAESLHDMAVQILGKKFSFALSILTLLFTYSCCVAFLIIGGDNIASWFILLKHPEFNSGWKRYVVILVYSLILPVALTLPKKMTFLSMFSTFSIFCLACYSVVVIMKTMMWLPKNGINKQAKAYDINLGFFNALAIYSLMFAMPAIILPIIKPTKPSITHRFRIIGSAFGSCYMFVLVPGVLGYLRFGNDVRDIVLASFEQKDVVIQAVRIAFFIVVTASYPVIALSITADLSALIFHINNPNTLPTRNRIIVLIIANVPPMIIACVCPNISPVLAVGGSLGGCLTNFFFPAILWIKQSPKPVSHWTNILCLMFAMFGLGSAVIATYRAVIVAINPHSDE